MVDPISIEGLSTEDMVAASESVAARMVNEGKSSGTADGDDGAPGGGDRQVATPVPARKPTAQAGDTTGDLTPEQLAALEAPAPIAADDPLQIPLEQVDEKYRPNFAAFRTKLEATTAELETERAKVAQMTANGNMDPAVLDEVRELRSFRTKYDLQNTDEFKAQYNTPIETAIAQIQLTVENFGGDSGLVDQLARMNPAERQKAIATNLPDAATYLPQLFAGYDLAVRNRAGALENHVATLKTEAGQEEAQAQAQLQEQMDALRTDVLTTAKEKVVYFKQATGDGDHAKRWNARATQMEAEYEQAMSATADEKVQAELILSGIIFRHMNPVHLATVRQLQDITTQFKARVGHAPKLGASVASGGRTVVQMGGGVLTAEAAARASAASLDTA